MSFSDLMSDALAGLLYRPTPLRANRDPVAVRVAKSPRVNDNRSVKSAKRSGADKGGVRRSGNTKRGKGPATTIPYKRHSRAASTAEPFHAGEVVTTTLNNPREKFWGALLSLTAAGISLRGMELASFDDALQTMVAGGSLSASVVFFPMHRVERIELDLPGDAIPSLSERFESRTGVRALEALSAVNRERDGRSGQ